MITFFSCKKDKLTGDAEILIGKWNWMYTTQFKDYPIYQYTTPLTPTNQGKTISMEFLKKGEIHFYENGECVDKKRIVFGINGFRWDSNLDEWSFSINLNNKNNDEIFGGIYFQNDSLIMRLDNYPFKDDNDERILKTNYFLKEK